MTKVGLLALCALFLIVSMPGEAAKRRLTVDTDHPEGVLLKQATDETDGGKRLALLEQFVEKFGKHESATWALGEMQAEYLKQGAFDKALAAGERVLADDADDVPVAQGNLKAAEGKKDAALIQKWAVATSDAARRVVKSAKPSGEEEAKHWEANVAYAKQVDTYCDYVLYAQATQATAPAEKIALAELLAARSPGAEYNQQLRGPLFVAYQQAGNLDKAQAIAEEELKKNDTNDDMLIFAAGRAYGKQEKAKAAGYVRRLIEIMAGKKAPAGMSEADWTKNVNLKLGVARWMLGMMAAGEQKWAEVDTQLRAALPLVKDNKELTAETLFHLGLANFKLGDPKGDKKRILDALQFNTQCAAIPGTYQAQARKNVAAIRGQYRIQ